MGTNPICVMLLTPSRLTHGIVTDVEGEAPSRLTDHVNSCKGDVSFTAFMTQS